MYIYRRREQRTEQVHITKYNKDHGRNNSGGKGGRGLPPPSIFFESSTGKDEVQNLEQGFEF